MGFLSWLIPLALGIFQVNRQNQARAEAAAASRYDFYRGVYGLCMGLYGLPDTCNGAVAEGARLGVDHNPQFSDGYVMPVEQP